MLTVEAKGLSSQSNAIQNQLKLLALENQSLQAIIDSDSLDDLNPLPSIPPIDDVDLANKMIATRNQTEQLRSQIDRFLYVSQA